MATYSPDDPVSYDLSCPICFEDYNIFSRQRAPKLLLCLHTFCFACAKRLWQPNGTLECSLCRTVHSGVALNDLFDNPVILEHLRKQCEVQDLELARRLDTEMRNRTRTPEKPVEVINLGSPSVEERPEERHIFGTFQAVVNRVPAAQAGSATPQVQPVLQEDEEEEDEGILLTDVHDNMSDTEEDCSDDDSVDGFLGACFHQDMAQAAQDMEDAMDDMADAMDDVADAMEDIAEVNDDLAEAEEEDEEEEEEVEQEEGEAQEEEEEDNEAVIPWMNHLEPCLHSAEEDDSMTAFNEYHEEDDNEDDREEEAEEEEEEEEEEDEEERWHSASDDIVQSWIDDDTPDSPDFVNWHIIL